MHSVIIKRVNRIIRPVDKISFPMHILQSRKCELENSFSNVDVVFDDLFTSKAKCLIIFNAELKYPSHYKRSFKIRKLHV